MNYSNSRKTHSTTEISPDHLVHYHSDVVFRLIDKKWVKVEFICLAANGM